MKLPLTQLYMAKRAASIKDVHVSAMSLNWYDLGGIESAQKWYEAFKAGSAEILSYRKLTNDDNCFEEALVAIHAAIQTGLQTWPEISYNGMY